MAEDARRIRAVAAALRAIRDRVDEAEHIEEWDTESFDNWIGMLRGAVEGELEHLIIQEEEFPRDDFLLHLDAAIGFLEAYEQDPTNVIMLKPRGTA